MKGWAHSIPVRRFHHDFGLAVASVPDDFVVESDPLRDLFPPECDEA